MDDTLSDPGRTVPPVRGRRQFRYAAGLSEVAKRRGVILVLGAGVSQGSRVPSWPQLIKKMFEAESHGALYEQLLKEKLDLPVLMSLLEQWSGDREEFIDKIRRSLYEDFGYLDRNMTEKANYEGLRADVDENNPTLRAIAAFCAHRARDGEYVRNARVRGVATLNVDGLLQGYMKAKYKKWLLKTIDRGSEPPVAHRTSVYHLHGYIRHDSYSEEERPPGPDRVVMTERDYFNTFNSPTSFSNYSFLHLLREHSAIFIGLSLSDENLRRLIHYSHVDNERVGAARLKLPQGSEMNLRHVALLNHKDSPEIDEAWEVTTKALGLHIEWLDSHAEIPTFLESVYEPNCGRWADVW